MSSSINTLTYVSLLLSIFVIASLVAPSTSNPTEKLTPESLKRVCLASGNPTCLRTLRHDPHTHTLSLIDLTLSYVEKAQKRASTTLLLIETLTEKTLERELIFKFRHCWTHYKVALNDLSHAQQKLKSGSVTGIAGLATTATTRASDCDDEFEDRKFSRPSELDRSNQELRAFSSVVFGLAAELVRP